MMHDRDDEDPAVDPSNGRCDQRTRGRAWVTLGLMALAASMVTACMSLERMAPPVENVTTGLGGQTGHATATLDRGRAIYLRKCSACHNVEPIDRYSIDHWQEILPAMAQEAQLGDPELADLSAYILSSHRFLSTAPPEMLEALSRAGKR